MTIGLTMKPSTDSSIFSSLSKKSPTNKSSLTKKSDGASRRDDSRECNNGDTNDRSTKIPNLEGSETFESSLWSQVDSVGSKGNLNLDWDNLPTVKERSKNDCREDLHNNHDRNASPQRDNIECPTSEKSSPPKSVSSLSLLASDQCSQQSSHHTLSEKLEILSRKSMGSTRCSQSNHSKGSVGKRSPSVNQNCKSDHSVSKEAYLKDNTYDDTLNQLLMKASANASFSTYDGISTFPEQVSRRKNHDNHNLLLDNNDEKSRISAIQDGACPQHYEDGSVTEIKQCVTDVSESETDLLSWDYTKILADAYMVLQDWDVALEFFIEARGLLVDDLFDKSLMDETESNTLIWLSWNESEILLGSGIIYFQRAMEILRTLKEPAEDKSINSKLSQLSQIARTKHQKELNDTLRESLRLLNEALQLKVQMQAFLDGDQATPKVSLELDQDENFLSGEYYEDHTQFMRLQISIARTHYFMGKAHFNLCELSSARKRYRYALDIYHNVANSLDGMEDDSKVHYQFSWQNKFGLASLFTATGDFHKARGHVIKAKASYEKAYSMYATIQDSACLGSSVYFEDHIVESIVDVNLKLASLERRSGKWSAALQYVTDARDMLHSELKHNCCSAHPTINNKCREFPVLRQRALNMEKKLYEVYVSLKKIYDCAGNTTESMKALNEAHKARHHQKQVDDDDKKVQLASIIMHFGHHHECVSNFNLALVCYKLTLNIIRGKFPDLGSKLAPCGHEEPTYSVLQFEAKLLNAVGKMYMKTDSNSQAKGYLKKAISAHVYAEVLRPFDEHAATSINKEQHPLEMKEDFPIKMSLFKDFMEVLTNLAQVIHCSAGTIPLDLTQASLLGSSLQYLKDKLSEIDNNAAAYICFMLAISFWKLRHDYCASVILIHESFRFIGEEKGIRGMFDYRMEHKPYEYSKGQMYEALGDIQSEAGEYHDSIEAYLKSVVVLMQVLKENPADFLLSRVQLVDKIVYIKIKLGVVHRSTHHYPASLKSMMDALMLAATANGIDTERTNTFDCNWEKIDWETKASNLDQKQMIMFAEIFYQLAETLVDQKIKAKRAYSIAYELISKVYEEDHSTVIKYKAAVTETDSFDWKKDIWSIMHCVVDHKYIDPM